MRKKAFNVSVNFDIEKFAEHFKDKVSAEDVHALKNKRALVRQKARERYALIKATP